MKYLLIDTSTDIVNIAVANDDNLLFSFHKKIESNLFVVALQLINEALTECSLSIKDIDKIFASVGPGSFTGIRIGLTIVKTISWALKKDVIPISSLEIIASSSFNSKYIVPYIDAKRENCYAAVYDSDLNIIENERFTSKIDFIENRSSDYKVVSYDSQNLTINFMKIIKKHINDLPINPHLINPNYLKKTEAEENLDKKNDNKN